MMTKDQLAREIFQVSYLTGTFQLRSGQISNEYFDKYRFESQPKILRAIAAEFKNIIPPGTEILAGLETGGIPLATALSLNTGIPALFVRKKAKDYGTKKIAEGLDFSGRKVCVIEDVITTGGQVLESTEELRKNGAVIDHVLCVIYRGPELPEKFDAFTKMRLQMHPLFTMEELKWKAAQK